MNTPPPLPNPSSPPPLPPEKPAEKMTGAGCVMVLFTVAVTIIGAIYFVFELYPKIPAISHLPRAFLAIPIVIFGAVMGAVFNELLNFCGIATFTPVDKDKTDNGPKV